MNKMNKKGFTLVEMLVVIAIIAVLVSIIIPVVSNATNKAACATNAANLRSVTAEATTNYLLTGEVGTYSKPLSKKTTAPDHKGGVEPVAEVVKDAAGNVSVVVTYDKLGIKDFADEAAGTSADGTK